MRVKKTLKGFDGFTRVFPEENIAADNLRDIPRYFQVVTPDNHRHIGTFLREGEDPEFALMREPNIRTFRLVDFYVVAQYEETSINSRT